MTYCQGKTKKKKTMLKNIDLKNKLEDFKTLGGLTGFQFVIALNKNKKLIESEIEILNEVRKESPELAELKKQFSEKQIELATKTKDGRPELSEDGRNVIMTDENKKKLEKFVNKLEKDNKKVLEEHKIKEDEFLKALDSKCTIEFFKIKEKDIPKDITVEQFDIISFMVE